MTKIENEVRRYWGQKGYWKQRLVMRWSYLTGSLKEAWFILNTAIEKIKAAQPKHEYEMTLKEEIELITKGMENSTYPIITIGD